VIVDVGILEGLHASQLAVAFVDSAWVRPGAGDALLHAIGERLRYLTHASLMLYSEDGRAYAPFQTHEFAKRIRREYMIEWIAIDLDRSWHSYQAAPAF
jgi:hypothetical protein